jgi:hypothetical protein
VKGHIPSWRWIEKEARVVLQSIIQEVEQGLRPPLLFILGRQLAVVVLQEVLLLFPPFPAVSTEFRVQGLDQQPKNRFGLQTKKQAGALAKLILTSLHAR